MRSCFRCGAAIDPDRAIVREDDCPECGQDLHCCRNCRFHDPTRNNQCSEPQADWVADKDRANFCEFFVFADRPAAAPDGRGTPESARDRFRKLFKDP